MRFRGCARREDIAHSPFIEQVIPSPIDQHHHPVAKSDEIEKMDDQPHPPGDKSGKCPGADGDSGSFAANGDH